MGRAVVETDVRRGALLALPRVALGASRRISWSVTAAVAALLILELALFAIVASKPALLTPHHYYGHYSKWQPTPLAGHVPSLGLGTTGLRVVFVGLLAAMFVPYLYLLGAVRSFGTRFLVTAIVCGHVVALLGPLVVTDVYNYIDFARLAVLHHLNPYVAAPAAARGEPLYHRLTWQGQPSSYGPLFTIGTYPLAKVTVIHAVWVVKLVTVLASLACIGLIYRCAQRVERPPGMCALAFGLNPIVLVYAVGGAHNDFFMLALILLGVYLLLDGRRGWSVQSLVAAIAIKATAAPVLLFSLAHTRRIRTFLVAVLGCAVLGGATVLLFGTHAPGFAAQARVLTPLSVPDLIGRLLGVSTHYACPIVYSCARTSVRVIADATLGAGLVFLLWRTWRGADWLTSIGWAMVLVVLTLSSVMPWYLVWILPFAVLSRSRRLRLVTAAVGAFLVIVSVPTSYLLLGPSPS